MAMDFKELLAKQEEIMKGSIETKSEAEDTVGNCPCGSKKRRGVSAPLPIPGLMP